MTSKKQHLLPFDHCSLMRCIAGLRRQGKRIHSLFNGLLQTAYHEPQRVLRIDAQGFMTLQASVRVVATWSGVDERTIQRCKSSLEFMFESVDSDLPESSETRWKFSMDLILPESSIAWFQDRISENAGGGILHEAQNAGGGILHEAQNAGVAFCARPPGILRAKSQNAGVAFQGLSSMCFSTYSARLAELFSVCEKFGIAIDPAATGWRELNLGSACFENPAIIDAIFESGVELKLIPPGKAAREKLFAICAAFTRRKNDWNYLSNIIEEGWFWSTTVTAVDDTNGRKLRRRADELKKMQTAVAERPQAVAASTPAAEAATERPRTQAEKDAKLAECEFGRKALARRRLQAGRLSAVETSDEANH